MDDFICEIYITPWSGDQGDFGSDPSKLHMSRDTPHLYAPASKAEIISNSSSINPMT